MQVAVTKYRVFNNDLTLYTVVTTWMGSRSSIMMQYSDFCAIDNTLLTAMRDSSSLLCKMPLLLSRQEFESTVELFKRWCIGKEESAHAPLKAMSDTALKAYLQVDVLQGYMVALGALVDRTPHMQTLLELLEVMPDMNSPDAVRRTVNTTGLYNT
jgi:hypothetical protein